MVYLRPTQTGFAAFDCYHELIYMEENCRKLFAFIESDTSRIKELLRDYFDCIIDSDSMTIKNEKPSEDLTEGIKKEMENLHPHLATDQYITAYRMLAEHLNQQIVEYKEERMPQEDYARLLQALVRPMYRLNTHTLPPMVVPTSNVFMERFYTQLKAMYNRPVHAAGLDYIEETRQKAERYLFWVLDRSSFRFKNLDRPTRVRLYSRIFRENIIGPDFRMEQCCYYREPKQYDYFFHSPSGQLLDAMQRGQSVEEAEAELEEKRAAKGNRREMMELLKTVTWDTQELPQGAKDFLNAELDAAAADSSATLFEEYRADSFDACIQLQLWLLTKGDTIIKRCRHCGRLFVAERLSSDYCNRIKDGEVEPCDIVGPKKAFARLMDEDHILKTYNRVYKTIYARKKRGSITDEKFTQWKTEARSLLDKTRAGKMSEEDFESWLTQDIRTWGDFGK